MDLGIVVGEEFFVAGPAGSPLAVFCEYFTYHAAPRLRPINTAGTTNHPVSVFI